MRINRLSKAWVHTSICFDASMIILSFGRPRRWFVYRAVEGLCRTPCWCSSGWRQSFLLSTGSHGASRDEIPISFIAIFFGLFSWNSNVPWDLCALNRVFLVGGVNESGVESANSSVQSSFKDFMSSCSH